MTEQDPDNNDAPAGAERLFEALRSAATDAGTRETLRELGDRARGVVEELARSARSRAAAAEARAAAEAEQQRRERETPTAARRSGSASSSVPPELARGLEELRGCVLGVADTLEATVERLETIEAQLGDPEEHVDARLARGLEHCEQVLRGIEHRVERAAAETAAEGPGQTSASAAAPVLVVASSSAVRASLCIDLERQGLRCLAASGLVAARRLAADGGAVAAVLVPDPEPPARAEMLEDWKDAEDQGSLPPAVVVDDGGGASGPGRLAADLGFPVTSTRHGAAALAAGLVRIARAAGAAEPTQFPEEQ